MEWISVNERLPKTSYTHYLCAVLIPEENGGFTQSVRVLGYGESRYGWDCDNMIVTHWAEQVELPEVFLGRPGTETPSPAVSAVEEIEKLVIGHMEGGPYEDEAAASVELCQKICALCKGVEK